MKKKDILQLIDDKIQLEGADQIGDDKLVIIVAKYEVQPEAGYTTPIWLASGSTSGSSR